jgi:3'-5' exoribonuclease
MRFISELHEGEKLSGIYLCKHKQAAVTKNGKSYENVILQDKTGTIDAKIWEPNSLGIDEFDALDYIDVVGDVTSFQGNLQVGIKRVRKASEGEYEPGNYLPVSNKDIETMYQELLGIINQVKNPYFHQLLLAFFKEDAAFVKTFKGNSAAKSVHHGFIGGLLEHTVSVANLCLYYCGTYSILNKDLLITAALLHDIGKTKELSAFPMNDYTDDGQLLGHIIIGSQMVKERIDTMPGFPKKLESELIHCILAHHGELEYGSPKKPALIEAMALNLADNADAKMETMTEILRGAGDNMGWLGYNRFMETNVRRTSEN